MDESPGNGGFCIPEGGRLCPVYGNRVSAKKENCNNWKETQNFSGLFGAGGKKNMKALIFGAGEATRSFLHLAPAARRIEVTGIVDNDSTKWGKTFEGYMVEPPETLKNGG